MSSRAPFRSCHTIIRPPVISLRSRLRLRQEHLELAWRSGRSNLMALFAGLHTHASRGKRAPATAMALRKKLQDDCWQEVSCRALCSNVRVNSDSQSDKSVNASTLEHIQQVHLRSEFCLQPEGDTPTRQSWFEALIQLCIPVFFADCLVPNLAFETLYAPFLPPHARDAFGAGPWAVVLNASEVVRRRPGWLAQQLRAIPPPQRASMRRTIAAIVPQILYPRRNVPAGNECTTASRLLRAALASHAGASRRASPR